MISTCAVKCSRAQVETFQDRLGARTNTTANYLEKTLSLNKDDVRGQTVDSVIRREH